MDQAVNSNVLYWNFSKYKNIMIKVKLLFVLPNQRLTLIFF